MPTGADRFRQLACGLAGAEESQHMGNPDFRVGGRIFATLSGQARGRGVLKLTVEQQAEFVAEMPGIFEPVEGGWGRMGMTYLILDAADDQTMRGSLATAHRNVAAKKALQANQVAAKKPVPAAGRAATKQAKKHTTEGTRTSKPTSMSRFESYK